MANQVVWFDVPVLNLDRAIAFYSAVLGTPVQKQEFPGMAIGMLPHGEGDVSGCLHVAEENRPSENGPLLYLNCQGRLDEALAAVEGNGGKVTQAKESIGPYGWRAIIRDSEGNRIALHST